MQWINVEHDLPEIGDYNVMCFFNHGGVDLLNVRKYFDSKWYESLEVSHWAILPEICKWENVENKLPEIGDYSVVCLMKEGSTEMLHVEDYFENEYYYTVGVTHWIDFPEDPKN